MDIYGLWATKWYGDYEHKRTKRNFGVFVMTKHNNMVAQKKFKPRLSGHEYAIGFVLEGMVQCVKSFEMFIDIGKDIGMVHISEVNHACMTNMDAMFVVGGKMKVSSNKFMKKIMNIIMNSR